ncbi:MAG TPA: hypothetical protein PK668_02375 [Myxococcota bacterium]|nr:hypothetical protein [Myxococcota bacterium]HRY94585.1 hypothetical protein [Myxococcota bacterium]HSA20333.1 hypothetical protein [Myxococcota bacterium]
MRSASLLAWVAVLAGAAAAVAGEEKPVETKIAFTGEVTGLVMLFDYEGKAIPIGADPRFALSVEVERVAPEDPSFTPGKVTVFAIHSPALLFGGTGLAEAKEIVGQRFDFTVEKHAEPGHCTWGALHVERHLPAPPAP